jgi:hypothetical protein
MATRYEVIFLSRAYKQTSSYWVKYKGHESVVNNVIIDGTTAIKELHYNYTMKYDAVFGSATTQTIDTQEETIPGDVNEVMLKMSIDLPVYFAPYDVYEIAIPIDYSVLFQFKDIVNVEFSQFDVQANIIDSYGSKQTLFENKQTKTFVADKLQMKVVYSSGFKVDESQILSFNVPTRVKFVPVSEYISPKLQLSLNAKLSASISSQYPTYTDKGVFTITHPWPYDGVRIVHVADK